MKKNVAVTIISVLAVISIALGILYFTNNDSKSKEIFALNSDVAEKNGQIETLTADVEGKSTQIETLT
ncbi:hypothetical protein SMA90_33890, partial [Escherichia coli]